MPVWCYARDIEGTDKEYYNVVRPKNMDKCFNFIVRNLNKTAGKNTTNDEFVKTYASVDTEYRRSPIACSVTKPKQQYGFLFTGDKDVSYIRTLGKKLGHERAYNNAVINSDNNYKLKNNDSFETVQAKNAYFDNAQNYTLKNGLKTQDGDLIGMQVFFDAVYKTNKKGERELKGFKYTDSNFVKINLKD